MNVRQLVPSFRVDRSLGRKKARLGRSLLVPSSWIRAFVCMFDFEGDGLDCSGKRVMSAGSSDFVKAT